MKKIMIWLLILVTLASSAACGDPKDEKTDETTTAAGVTDTSAEIETETVFKAFDTLELKNYGGYEFDILYTQTERFYTDFHAPELNGAILNDAIFERNLKVEEALDVKINIKWQSYSQVNADLQTQVQADSYDYDMYGGHKTSLTLSYSGYLYNFYNMEDIDLSQEWWDQDWLASMSYADSIHTLVGDMCISHLLLVQAMTFNKKLFDDNSLEYPYELVREKKWTYDALYNYIKDYTADVNGDGQITWESDRYGLTGWGTESGYSTFYGSAFSFITKTPDDKYKMEFNAERLTAIMDKVFSIWYTANSYFNNTGSGSEHHKPFMIFKEDRALLCDVALCKIGSFLSDMESDYGILPEPMFDENQKDYNSYTGYSIPLIMVPVNCPDPGRTGKVMEALCTASYDDVVPDMYEIVTMVKNARDAESSEMIRIIIRTKAFDPAHWYTISGYGTFSRDIIATGNKNFASMLKTYEKVAEKNLESIIKSYEGMKK